METISNQTHTKCSHCGEWTNYAGDIHYRARCADIDRLTARAEAAEAELQRLREQEPVAWRWCWNTYRRHGEDGWGYSEGQPPDRENATVEPLYPAPVPPPDVRELVEALSPLVPDMPPTDATCHVGISDQQDCPNCQRIARARAALAKHRGQS